ncbi:MAG: helix-turn-helix transcriptional regulator [Clostridia bacterium]|nr:helix-turn-helix transcriptional regulator [Clostridia bacterium]
MDKTVFGKRVKAVRKQMKMTQIELAEAIGKKEATIRKYENGSIEAPWNVIEDIASVLGVSPFDLTVDIEKLRSDVKLIEEIEKAFGSDALAMLNDFDTLNSLGKSKAVQYVADLAIHPKYKKEPSSAATENDSNNN